MHNSLIRIDDKLASRGCQHMNLIVAQLGDTQVIFQFGGESIPGLLQVVSTSYTKDGRWSHHRWDAEAAPGVGVFRFSQDFGTGTYLPEGRWAEARQNFRRQAGTLLLDDEAIDRFIRARLPDAAARLDAELAMTQEDPTPFLLAVFVQQERLSWRHWVRLPSARRRLLRRLRSWRGISHGRRKPGRRLLRMSRPSWRAARQ